MGPSQAASPYREPASSANLADILERVLDKGVVIAGDIQINLLDIELLTIKLRLLVASVDKAKEMGIDWWEHDPSLSSKARPPRDAAREEPGRVERPEGDTRQLEPAERDEIAQLRAEVAQLRSEAATRNPVKRSRSGSAAREREPVGRRPAREAPARRAPVNETAARRAPEKEDR
ncbi:gas vesicle protein GvpJ [Streptomyces sp. NPDC051784]|uniref:gas vesicle protein n=1 Tax=Streptomyces sp. NPDC051784 TaxID=3155805 RepID=UPI0034155354